MAPHTASNTSRQGMTNPFYRNSDAAASNDPPPSYGSHSSHPTSPPVPSSSSRFEPVQYSSLSNLKNQKAAPNHQQAFEYVPQSSRQGYHSGSHYESGGMVGGSAARNLPPMPQGGMMPPIPSTPPRRTVSAPPLPPAPALPPRAPLSYQGYVPASAQSGLDSARRGISSAGERIADGFNSVATQQRKEQILGGIGKLGMGAVKLAGKGVYQVGKFATK
ncbi:uncharacterized protein L203_101310 [Cryptococcus depauperatus CBS 7841]|uniref:Uncharacterized protein n=1 Tax=Cryptococcus depauperatus CBS 7841 TaxID=1295531 RepID=A0A1E3IC75_9TREE|nr:hypothetical protein L203_04330 [Cryptococcus depauperatus CBS 7841]